MQQGPGIGVGTEALETKAGPHRDVLAAPVDVMAVEGVFEDFGAFQSVFPIGTCQQHGKFVTAQTRHQILGSDAVAQHAGDFDQHLVPGGVAVGIVNRLEAV